MFYNSTPPPPLTTKCGGGGQSYAHTLTFSSLRPTKELDSSNIPVVLVLGRTPSQGRDLTAIWYVLLRPQVTRRSSSFPKRVIATPISRSTTNLHAIRSANVQFQCNDVMRKKDSPGGRHRCSEKTTQRNQFDHISLSVSRSYLSTCIASCSHSFWLEFRQWSMERSDWLQHRQYD